MLKVSPSPFHLLCISCRDHTRGASNIQPADVVSVCIRFTFSDLSICFLQMNQIALGKKIIFIITPKLSMEAKDRNGDAAYSRYMIDTMWTK